jgi:hypothetical protein
MADSPPICGELVTHDSSLKLQIRTDRPPILWGGFSTEYSWQARVEERSGRREGDGNATALADISVGGAANDVRLLSFQQGRPGRALEVSGKSCEPRGLFGWWFGFFA